MEQRASLAVVDLVTRQQESEQMAEAVGERVDLRRASAPRAADGLVLLPPFPLAAQRYAFTMERRSAPERPASLGERLKQSDPDSLATQRTKRL